MEQAIIGLLVGLIVGGLGGRYAAGRIGGSRVADAERRSEQILAEASGRCRRAAEGGKGHGA